MTDTQRSTGDRPADARLELFDALGAEWNATKEGLSLLASVIVLGIVVRERLLEESPAGRLLWGAVTGGLIVLAMVLHVIGHIISAHAVGGPLKEVLVTSPPIFSTLYHDKADPPSRVHLGRAVGGPVMNLSVAKIALLLWEKLNLHTPGQNQLYGTFTYANLILGLVALLPIPSVDGGVIRRELFSNTSENPKMNLR